LPSKFKPPFTYTRDTVHAQIALDHTSNIGLSLPSALQCRADSEWQT